MGIICDFYGIGLEIKLIVKIIHPNGQLADLPYNFEFTLSYRNLI